MRTLLAALVVNDDGQDIVEYALLAALVAVLSIAAFAALRDALAGAYANFDQSQQTLSAAMPDPAP